MMLDKIEQIAQNQPDRIACEIGLQSITFKNLWEQSQRYAALLRRQGTGPVMLYGQKSVGYITAILACLLAQRSYVPVGKFTPPDRLRCIASLSNAELLLSDDLPNVPGLFCCSLEYLDRFSDRPAMESCNNVAYIMFTSGSTGQPKGVPISRNNLNSFIRWIGTLPPLCGYHGVNVFNQADFSFDLSVADLYYSLCYGNTLTALPFAAGEDLSASFAALRQCHVAVVTPTFLKLCLLDPDFYAERFPLLRCVYSCGEPLEPITAQKLLEAFPALNLLNAYGPTEATSAVSAALITKEMAQKMPLLPVGQEGRFATDISVVDGEIVLKGDSVFSGYLDGRSGGFFCENGVNCYCTGDLGFFENAFLFCSGRKDRQIKYMGYRIELDEIEFAISRINGVRQCAVIAKKDENGAIRCLKAFVAASIVPMRIREALRKKLPPYMIPRNILVVESLPVTPNGKIDRKALENDG